MKKKVLRRRVKELAEERDAYMLASEANFELRMEAETKLQVKTEPGNAIALAVTQAGNVYALINDNREARRKIEALEECLTDTKHHLANAVRDNESLNLRVRELDCKLSDLVDDLVAADNQRKKDQEEIAQVRKNHEGDMAGLSGDLYATKAKLEEADECLRRVARQLEESDLLAAKDAAEIAQLRKSLAKALEIDASFENVPEGPTQPPWSPGEKPPKVTPFVLDIDRASSTVNRNDCK